MLTGATQVITLSIMMIEGSQGIKMKSMFFSNGRFENLIIEYGNRNVRHCVTVVLLLEVDGALRPH